MAENTNIHLSFRGLGICRSLTLSVLVQVPLWPCDHSVETRCAHLAIVRAAPAKFTRWGMGGPGSLAPGPLHRAASQQAEQERFPEWKYILLEPISEVTVITSVCSVPSSGSESVSPAPLQEGRVSQKLDWELEVSGANVVAACHRREGRLHSTRSRCLSNGIALP